MEKEYYKFYLDVSHCGTTFQNTKTMVFIRDQVLPDKKSTFEGNKMFPFSEISI